VAVGAFCTTVMPSLARPVRHHANVQSGPLHSFKTRRAS
jgi:hypothetical protein